MSDLRDLARRPAPWLVGEAPERDIVLSSRIRLARNLDGERFTHVTPADELCAVRERILDAAGEVERFDGTVQWNMEDLEEIERRFLLERHLISVDLVRYVLGRAVLVSEDESQGLMINEEDHLRLQTFAAGLAPRRALDRASEMVQSLDGHVPFAFHPELGYLTACPTNVGTGMRASILVHLPGLVLTGDIDKVLNGLRRLNYTVRGFYGEGSGVMGSLFQVSNSVTLGRSEGQIVDDLMVHTRKVIEVERRARGALVERDRVRLEDRVWRAWALLRHGRLLSTHEAFDLLSDLRLGSTLSILPSMDESVLNTLLINVQSAHLQVSHGRTMNATQRDEARAEYVREQLERAVERNEDR